MQANEANIMLQKFENYLITNMGSRNTVRDYLERANHFFSRYSEMNQENIDDYFRKIKEKELTSATFNKTKYALLKYCEWAKLDIEFPKTQKINPIVKKKLTMDEIEKQLFPYFKMLFNDPDKRMFIVRFMTLTMLRLSEVTQLKKSDIDFNNREIRVLGKGNKERSVPLHKKIVEDTKYYVGKTEGESAFGITNRYVTYIFDRINNKLSYKKKISPHSLRHAGAMYFYEETNHDLKSLCDILGHSTTATTDKYLGKSFEDLKSAMDQVKYKKGKK
jgi:integrase/recombinase XerC